jgi:hypothetical protein
MMVAEDLICLLPSKLVLLLKFEHRLKTRTSTTPKLLDPADGSGGTCRDTRCLGRDDGGTSSSERDFVVLAV